MRLELTTKHDGIRQAKIRKLNDYEHPDSAIQNFFIVCTIMSRIWKGSQSMKSEKDIRKKVHKNGPLVCVLERINKELLLN